MSRCESQWQLTRPEGSVTLDGRPLDPAARYRVTVNSFLAAGGESFQQIPCLNDHPAYIDFLAKRTARWLTGASA